MCIVLVSDLHLSAGPRASRASSDGHDHGASTAAAFVRFLDDLRARAAVADRRYTLVFLGDLFDFRRVELDRDLVRREGTAAVAGASAGLAVAKLDRIAEHHPLFFGALGEWLSTGLPIQIVPGNHDTELLYASVQRCLARLLRASGEDRPMAARVTIHPWILHVPGVLYAEHGHQYDSLGSYALALRPYPPDQPDRIEPTLGSYFASYVLDRIRPIDPSVDWVRPHSRYLVSAFRTRPLWTLGVLRFYARFFLAVLGQVLGGWNETGDLRRADYRRAVLPSHASELGLSPEAVLAIDRLAAKPALSDGLCLARTLYVRGVSRAGRAVAQPPASLRRAALTIDGVLRGTNERVPTYIFGHSHKAEDLRVGGDDSERYLNTGTWSRSIAGAGRPTPASGGFPFVEITSGTGGSRVAARLRYWDDVKGSPGTRLPPSD